MNPHEIKLQIVLEASMLMYITADDSIPDTALEELQQCIESLSNDLSEDQIEAVKAKVMSQLVGGE